MQSGEAKFKVQSRIMGAALHVRAIPKLPTTNRTEMPDLAPTDKALIERAISGALRSIYRDVPFEPLPDDFQKLLEQLSEQEARRGEPHFER
jgi:hypothetical protein